MARNLGWDESQRSERPFGPGRRFNGGHGHRHGHPGSMRGFGPRHPFGDEPQTDTRES